MVKPLILSGLNVCAEEGVKSRSGVLIANGILQEIAAEENLIKNNNAEKVNFPENYYLVPGFIDLHIHGANGKDVMDGNTEALTTISQALAHEGTTGFLATTMTAAESELDKALQAVAKYRRVLNHQNLGAEVLGIHLEGPFLSHKKMGAQAPNFAQLPNIDLFKAWQKQSEQAIKLITLAPELAHGLEFIHYLKQNNVVVSLGHSNANYAEAQEAINAGITHATHLFNAMPSIHHREPGAVTALLLAEQVIAELIVDGIHLHPAIVQLALKVKGRDNLILVTDAMRAKCLTDGCYDLGGQNVYVKQQEARLVDGTLAGSVLPMAQGLRNIMKFTQCSLADAIAMVATNPAKILNLQSTKGSIKAGKDADLVVLNDKYEVVMTLRAGKIIYSQLT